MERWTENGSFSASRSAAGRKSAREGSSWYTILFERSPLPVWILDLSRASEEGAAQRVSAIDANPAAMKFHEAPTKAVLLSSAEVLFGPDSGSFMTMCSKAADEREIVVSFEAEVATLTGSKRLVVAHWTIAPGCERTLSRVVVSLEDITSLRRAEAVGKARLALLDFSVSHSLDELLQETLDKAEELTGSFIGFFHTVAEDGRTLVLQNWSTRTKKEFCSAEGKGSHYDIDKAGVWVECARVGRPVIHNDYASLPGRKGLPPGHAPVTRELVVPISRGGSVSAILGVGNKEAPYDDGDIAAVSKLADFAWEIAERKRTEETLRCLATSFASLSGRNFFDAAARRLATELMVDKSLIAAFTPGDAELSVLGESGPSGIDRIPISGSPFERLAAGEEPAFADSLGELFPDDELVSSIGARSLLVRVLRDGGKRTVIVAVLDSKAMHHEERLFSVIDLYKDRIIAEVRRVEAERALASMNAGLEEEVRTRSIELERAAKLAMLGRLVAGIAHELSTPLAAISSANDSLGESMGRCIPGLPGFLADAGSDEQKLFARLISVLLAKSRPRDETALRSRKRRWRAAAREAGIADADGAMEMLADIGDDPTDEELVRMLRIPRFDEVISKAFLISRSFRASQVIRSATEKASRTVRALRTYAHDAPGDLLEEVDLKESVESTLDLYFGPGAAGADISMRCEPTPPVFAQPDRLSQVWANLISNAIQASRGRAKVEVYIRPEGNRCLVSIADDGPGIPEEAKSLIFTPFFTTKAPGEGLGLGLDICKRIVEETDGSIRFASAPGRTVFTVALPSAKEPG